MIRQLVGPLALDRSAEGPGPAPDLEQRTDLRRSRERSVGPARPQAVGTNQHGHGPAVPGEGDLLTRGDTVEQLRQRRPGLTDCDRRRHRPDCTPLYNNAHRSARIGRTHLEISTSDRVAHACVPVMNTCTHQVTAAVLDASGTWRATSDAPGWVPLAELIDLRVATLG
jgi:hypothetical protein